MKALACSLLALTLSGCGTTAQDLGGDHPSSSGGSGASSGSGNSSGSAGSGGSGLDVGRLFAGGNVTCLQRPSGVVKCWGQNDLGQLSVASTMTCSGQPCARDARTATNLAQVSTIALGNRFGCAIAGDGNTICWGDNSLGQLGRGTSDVDGHIDPLPVAVTNAKAVVTGAQHACALTAAGDAWCWGLGESGQLGLDPSTLASCPVPEAARGAPGVPDADTAACALEPAEVPAFKGAVQLALGDAHSCARFEDGHVVCVGRGGSGELGGGDRPEMSFEPVEALASGAETLAVGGRHSCAVLERRVRCWGANEAGQLGVGSTTQEECSAGKCLPTPTLLGDLPATLDLALGQNFSCARLTNSKLRCWGSDARGQLGNSSFADETCTLASGDTIDCLPRPLQDAYQLDGALQLCAGSEHACATINGEVRCWGSASNAQTGGHDDATFAQTVYGLNLDRAD